MWCIFDNPDPIFTLQLVSLRKSCLIEIETNFSCYNSRFSRKIFPLLFEMTIILHDHLKSGKQKMLDLIESNISLSKLTYSK